MFEIHVVLELECENLFFASFCISFLVRTMLYIDIFEFIDIVTISKFSKC